ncbi:amidohydrolase family protein [Marinicella sp. S1101]|uniref:amidohydrolase family protein n=1 Tax=Marinicella marina TaxID=2996016 RepID=UPI0022609C91|nr:amidohydrolase family protein [Marinicella marina]MCX7554893.1 amidohydrolase family protein [Marinicella marina]MDJ1141283.1 amidohydrolase family protein [Marinicella marina]
MATEDHLKLPIKLDSTSNGEFIPVPLAPPQCLANDLAKESTAADAKATNSNRRQFLKSSCGVASTLLAFNSAFAKFGMTGGFYQLSADASKDPQLAKYQVDGNEFIFDVQGHFVNPNGDWLKKLPETAKPLAFMPKAQCDLATNQSNRNYLNCLGSEEFIKDVFMDSDTDLMVLSFVPSAADNEPLTIQEAAATRAIIDQMDGNHRLLLHGRVNPNQSGDLEGMDALAEEWQVAAFKTYTQFGPDGIGYWLSDDVGLAMIEKAQKLGVRNICIHKGIPFGQQSFEHSLSDDVGQVAKLYPEMNFIIYHSGYDMNYQEQAYQPDNANRGVDSLIHSVLKHQVKPNSNVYAELGSTWRFLMRDPNQAAHVMAKLIKYVGEDNVLWGTDSIWYGSPQDQIQAFRTFQIGQEFQEKYGYQTIMPQLKAKIFGLNATKPYQISAEEVNRFIAKDALTAAKQNYLNDPNPHFNTYGPKTRREYLNLLKWGG